MADKSDSEQTPVNHLSFEKALQEFETIVKKLESGDIPLEDSIAAYERGIALKKHCETKLQEAQAKIEKITIQQDGSPATAPLAEQES